MLNAIIKSGRFRICILFVNSIIILTYIIVYCGCSTTEVLTESPDVQKPGFTHEIKCIELLNGKEIDCEDKLMKIEKTSVFMEENMNLGIFQFLIIKKNYLQ